MLFRSNDGMAITNLKGKFLDVNVKLCTTLGYTREELLQMHIINLTFAEHQNDFKKNRTLLREKGYLFLETILIHKDGTPVSLDIRISILRLDDTPVIQIVARDITKRRHREKILHSYKQITSLTDDPVAFVDKDYIYQLVNKRSCRDQKHKKDTIIGMSVSAIFGEKIFLETIKPQFDRCLSGETVRYQAWFELDNRERRYRGVSYYPHRSADGKIIGILAIIHTLTDLELAKEEWEVERERLDNILQIIPDGVYIVNHQYIIEYINPTIEKELGPVNDKKCFEYLHDRTGTCTNCQKENVFSENSIHRKWHSTDANKDYEIFDSPLKNADGIFKEVALFHDVTEEKKTRQTLEKNEMLLSGIINNSHSLIFVKDTQGKYLLVNDQFENYFNTEVQNIVGKTDFDLFPEKQARKIQANDQEVLKNRMMAPFEDVLQLRGSEHVFISNKFPLSDSKGSVYGLAGISTDITQRKQLEYDLQENNKRLTALIKALPDIICFKNGKGKWLLANEAILQKFQLTDVAYKGKTDAELAKYSEFYHDALLTCMESDEEAWNKGTFSRAEEIIPTPGGEDNFFNIVKIPLFHTDGTRQGLVVIGHDITEHLKIEENLRQELVSRKRAAKIMTEKSKDLEEANIALRVLVKQQKDVAGEVQQNVLAQLEKTVLPYISLLRQSQLEDKGKAYLDIISSHVSEVGRSFIKKLSNPGLKLTQKEILVADLVRQGKSTKEIAQLLTLKGPSVETYRNKIRKKLSINNKKVSLYKYLSVTFASES